MKVLRESQDNALDPPYPHCVAATQFFIGNQDQWPQPTTFVTNCFSNMGKRGGGGQVAVSSFNSM